MRRKYQFADRAEAEAEYRKADRRRLMAEWLLTAKLNGTAVDIGQAGGYVIGYVLLPHSAIVYSLKPGESVHCVSGVWDLDSQDLRDYIASLVRYSDTYEHGILLEKARTAAYAAFA